MLLMLGILGILKPYMCTLHTIPIKKVTTQKAVLALVATPPPPPPRQLNAHDEHN